MSYNENNIHGCGCIRDPYDVRDYIFTPPSGAVKYPESFQLKEVAIKDQGIINSCVAHSCATIKEIQEYYETGKTYEFSVGWIYGYRLDNHYKGEGMYPREALKVLQDYGNVFKSDFPENLEYDQLQSLIEKRKSTCISKGKTYKIKSYARVTSVNNVKAALYNYHSPVMIIMNTYSDFQKLAKPAIVNRNRIGNNTGSHAMVIVGWKVINNVEYYIVQNSWGKNWGDNGYCYIKPGLNIITDLYTSIDEKNVTKVSSLVNNI